MGFEAVMKYFEIPTNGFESIQNIPVSPFIDSHHSFGCLLNTTNIRDSLDTTYMHIPTCDTIVGHLDATYNCCH